MVEFCSIGYDFSIVRMSRYFFKLVSTVKAWCPDEHFYLYPSL
jgi:hypothetical protein